MSSYHTGEIPPHRRVDTPLRIHIRSDVVDAVEAEEGEHETEKRVKSRVHRCCVCVLLDCLLKLIQKKIKFRLYTDYTHNTQYTIHTFQIMNTF